jgi:hypothetical protein
VTLLVKKTGEKGNLLTKTFFENISLRRGDRESLLLAFNEAIKAMRMHRRLLVVWMSSNICVDDCDILHVLPIDLCRSVSKFV